MKIIRFKNFKFIKSKYDGRTYLRCIFNGFDSHDKFLAFPVDKKNQLCAGEDLLSDELRDYIRGQCMLSEASAEVNHGN
jgi:hypothetical protein